MHTFGSLSRRHARFVYVDCVRIVWSDTNNTCACRGTELHCAHRKLTRLPTNLPIDGISLLWVARPICKTTRPVIQQHDTNRVLFILCVILRFRRDLTGNSFPLLDRKFFDDLPDVEVMWELKPYSIWCESVLKDFRSTACWNTARCAKLLRTLLRDSSTLPSTRCMCGNTIYYIFCASITRYYLECTNFADIWIKTKSTNCPRIYSHRATDFKCCEYTYICSFLRIFNNQVDFQSSSPWANRDSVESTTC